MRIVFVYNLRSKRVKTGLRVTPETAAAVLRCRARHRHCCAWTTITIISSIRIPSSTCRRCPWLPATRSRSTSPKLRSTVCYGCCSHSSRMTRKPPPASRLQFRWSAIRNPRPLYSGHCSRCSKTTSVYLQMSVEL